MKLENLKHKIDSYFDSVTSEEVIEHLKGYGYSFEPIDESDYEVNLATFNTNIQINDIDTSFNSFESDKLIKECLMLLVEYIDKSDIFDSNSGESNYSLAA